MGLKLNKPKKDEWGNYKNYSSEDYIAEAKLDGVRCTLQSNGGTVTLIRENGIVKDINYPEIIDSMHDLPPDTTVDGEVCILKNEFYADFFNILRRESMDEFKQKFLRKSLPVTFVAFDILKYRGDELLNKTTLERKGILNILSEWESDQFKIIKQYEPEQLLPQVEKYEMEGIVIKPKHGEYFSKWIKFKHYLEGDFKVVGWNSTGKRLISTLELTDKDNVKVGNVKYINYPMTEEWKNKVVGMTAVITYMKTNTEKLRFPVLKELREVKK